MKIALVVPGFSSGEGDWCIPALLDLVRCLAAGAEVHVFALRYPHRTEMYRVYGAQVHALGGATGRAVRSTILWGRAWQAVAAEHRRSPFRVLHAFWANEAGFVAAVAGRMLNIPVVVSLAGGELVGFRDIGYGGRLRIVERLKTRYALTSAARVTGGSAYLLALARQHLSPSSHSKLRRLPLGVDTGRFSYCPAPGRAADGRLRLLHVANLIPVKDQATLLRAVADAGRLGPEVTLDMAGDGPDRPILENLAAGLGLTRAIRWHGAVAHDALPALYRAADVFILSSRHEAQGMVMLEAAATGRPILSTAVGVAPELAPEAAIVAAVGDAAALARAVLASVDADRRVGMGLAAYERVCAEYQLDQAAQRFTALWEEAAEARPAPGHAPPIRPDQTHEYR